MPYIRRQALKLFGLTGLALPLGLASCGLTEGAPMRPRLVRSRLPLPQAFITRLAVPPVLRPVRSDATTDYYEMTLRPAQAEILPGVRTTVWGYEGIFPGPTISAARGRPAVIRQTNQLPVPIVTHLHGGRTPPESDGYPTDLVLPANGEFPSSVADPQASITREVRDYIYPHDQQAATLWYHDHRMDFTAPQVWRGLAGFHLIHDDAEAALPLPNGEKDIPLMICDRAFEADGSLLYPSAEEMGGMPQMSMQYLGGVLGDVILVNGKPWPYLEVSNTRYRFRLLNASNARRYVLELQSPAGATPFVQIGSDGGLLASSVTLQQIAIAPAERFDVVVDFGAFPVGSSVTMFDRANTALQGGIMRFLVTRSERDESAVPDRLVEVERLNPATASASRHFAFSRKANGEPIWLINGKPFDPMRMDARPELGSTEVWYLTSDLHHPVHLHLVHFQVLSHAGRPTAIDGGWKDTVDLGPGQTAKIIARFDGYKGRYVFHCHNLEHEDMAMMGNFEVV
jgi:spore coat protein A, manganese oxidase